MKRIVFLSIVVFSLLWLFVLSINYKVEKAQNAKLRRQVDSLIMEIEKKRKLIHFKDSLYHEHLKKCAFVDREQLDTIHGIVYVRTSYKDLLTYLK